MARTSLHSRNRSDPSTGYLIVFVAASVLYIATCAPGPVWQDSGVIQYRVLNNDIEGRLGLALSHPLYYGIAIIARHLPFGDPAYKVNVVTSLISAFAVANLYLLLRLWLNSPIAALVGALSLALSHTFWRHATIPETYNLTVALLLLELIALLNYARSSRILHLYLLAFVNGLAIANHMLATIPLACYLVLLVATLLKKRITFRHLGWMAVAWMIGAAPFEYLFVKHLLHTHSISATLASAAFGDSWRGNVLNTSLSLKIFTENFMWFVLNYPTPNILLGITGISYLGRVSPKPWFGRIVLALSFLFLAFAFRYTIIDRYAFFIPFYCMVSILIGVGLCLLVTNMNRRSVIVMSLLFCFLTIPAYIAAPRVATRLGMSWPREIPYRNIYTYILRPWRTGYDGAEKFADEALDQVASDAIIYADTTTAPPLLYVQQVKGKRDDVKIISDIGSSPGAPACTETDLASSLARGVMYVVSPQEGYCPAFILEKYDFEQAGILYRVVTRSTGK